ncbi:fibronectin type III domain protein [Mumia flava]|uniref:Fibronectin type III domain protein n=1 Tax=Mumia flava TaxID=1348852 RepID=A0A0B2BQT7_9ACTN|nr:fibronectin type III domain-containing protein [Mumia flava]PJJ56213.1 fibronectin type III domain protein [Mumia flava]
MRRLRSIAAAAALVLAAPTAAVTAVSSPAAGVDVEVLRCSEPGAGLPCVASVTRDGVAIPAGHPVWDLYVHRWTYEGGRVIGASLLKNGDPDIGGSELGHRWVVTLETGSMIPRVVTGSGRDVAVQRSRPGGYRVRLALDPVTISGQCDQSSWPWTCPEWADDPDPVENGEWDAALNFQVTDFGQWRNTTQRAASYGMTFFTNVAASSGLPEIVDDPAGRAMLRILLANRHYREDGTTVVRGRTELVVPDAFLRVAYGVPDPSTLTTSGIDVLGAGGATVRISLVGSELQVLLDNMTFSARNVRIRRGTVTPTRPTKVRAKRVKARKGAVRYRASKARGARIKGYKVMCKATRGHHRRKASAGAAKRKIVVKRLKRNRAYRCRVVARSAAGPSAQSRAVKLRRR